MYPFLAYIKFLCSSTNQHGVHSPFVYDLLTKSLYKKEQHIKYLVLKKYRETLKKSSDTIEVTDFGAGSRVFSSNKRKVARIAKHVGVSKKRQKLLFKLTYYFKPKECLELGTSLGMATAAMSLANPESNITTVEGCPSTANFTASLFKDFKLQNIELVNATFKYFFSSEGFKKNYDFIYVDGNHDKEKTISYFEILLSRVHNNSIIIFDDIYWSKPMTEAWKYIYNHPKVTVSIDTFQWGIIFFRKEQPKQHFKIRV